MTDNRTTELLCKLLDERGAKWRKSEGYGTGCIFVWWDSPIFGEVHATENNDGTLFMACLNNCDFTPEQAIAATLGSDDRYDAGFASGVQAVFQQLEGIEDYEGLQDLIAEYWGEGEGNDER